jgi:hypothetical protein
MPQTMPLSALSPPFLHTDTKPESWDSNRDGRQIENLKKPYNIDMRPQNRKDLRPDVRILLIRKNTLTDVKGIFEV